jgi:hypothetical protein
MATFDTEIEVGDPRGERWQTFTATVGTKAAFAWVPEPVLQELGVEVEKRVSLRHLDGRLIKRDVGQTKLRVGGQERIVTVVFGAKRDPVLVGSTTLEEMSLKADFTRSKVVPAEAAEGVS